VAHKKVKDDFSVLVMIKNFLVVNFLKIND